MVSGRYAEPPCHGANTYSRASALWKMLHLYISSVIRVDPSVCAGPSSPPSHFVFFWTMRDEKLYSCRFVEQEHNCKLCVSVCLCLCLCLCHIITHTVCLGRLPGCHRAMRTVASFLSRVLTSLQCHSHPTVSDVATAQCVERSVRERLHCEPTRARSALCVETLVR